MTRLDSVIRRLTAQRDLLDWAAGEIDPGGLVLELGLGNGRTYDHLRDRLPGREIYVFERSPAAHPSCMPADSYMIVGDIFDTLPEFTRRFGPGCAALIHVDIGTGDEDRNRRAGAARFAVAGGASATRRAASGRPGLCASSLRRYLGRQGRAGRPILRVSTRESADSGHRLSRRASSAASKEIEDAKKSSWRRFLI